MRRLLHCFASFLLRATTPATPTTAPSTRRSRATQSRIGAYSEWYQNDLETLRLAREMGLADHLIEDLEDCVRESREKLEVAWCESML